MSRELVLVVDHNDQPIKAKLRKDISDTDIIRVSTLWVENGEGDVLLQQRSLTKKLGTGQWQGAVAGTVESHETYLDNIIEEASEEIGLTNFTPIEVCKRYTDNPDGKFNRMIMFYKTTCNKPIDYFTLEVGEAEQLKWVNKVELFEDVQAHPEKYVSSARLWKELY